MLILLNCHFNQLGQEVHEVHMMRGPHEPLEQVNWNDIQANLT